MQFADKGLKVVLSIDVETIKDIHEGTEVWIINTNSRNIPGAAAYEKVKKAAGYLKSWGACCYYKKIDSTLRGNIPEELEALIESLGIKKLPLCAAFPSLGRTTVNSVQYVHRKKVSESSFGSDVSSPVVESNIEKLLDLGMKFPERVSVKDASTDEDLELLAATNTSRVVAGAAAWAGKLVNYWTAAPLRADPVVIPLGPVLVVSGSLNPLSLKQNDYWKEMGLKSMEAPANIKMKEDFLLLKTSMNHSNDALNKLNNLACGIWRKKVFNKVILNGGDTAFGFMKCVGVNCIEVIKSLTCGIALTSANGNYYVLKPGGYGESDTLFVLAKRLKG